VVKLQPSITAKAEDLRSRIRKLVAASDTGFGKSYLWYVVGASDLRHKIENSIVAMESIMDIWEGYVGIETHTRSSFNDGCEALKILEDGRAQLRLAAAVVRRRGVDELWSDLPKSRSPTAHFASLYSGQAKS